MPDPSPLDPDAHLLLDAPLLRLPHELLRKNLKSAQRQVEIANKSITTSLSSSKSELDLAALDATLAKAQNLKRKLEALHEEEKGLHEKQAARLRHIDELHAIPSVDDVKYERWASVRAERVLVDYLIRGGYLESARALVAASEGPDLALLTDVPVFEEVLRIERSLRAHELKDALAWCAENKQALKKMGSQLEAELRLQQFIEMARSGEVSKLVEGIGFARKYLAGIEGEIGLRAAGVLAHTPATLVEPYRTLWSPSRYQTLADMFLHTHHTLFSLPQQPILHTALSAGLSALKTPTCHSAHNPQSSSNHHTSSLATTTQNPSPAAAVLSTTGPLCPICSTELNELAKGVPYAHHTKSLVEDDPVVLPNGRVFGREKLRSLNEKLGVTKGKVRDPVEGLSGMEWRESDLRKVFIV